MALPEDDLSASQALVIDSSPTASPHPMSGGLKPRTWYLKGTRAHFHEFLDVWEKNQFFMRLNSVADDKHAIRQLTMSEIERHG